MKNKKFITLGFASVTASMALMFSSSLFAESSIKDAQASRLQALEKFTKVISIVQQYDVDDVTIEELIDKALDGMMKKS